MGRLATSRDRRSSKLSRRHTARGDQSSRVRGPPTGCSRLSSQLRRPPSGSCRRTDGLRPRTDGLPWLDQSCVVVGARDRAEFTGKCLVGPRPSAPRPFGWCHPPTHLCDLTNKVQSRRISSFDLHWKVCGTPAESAASAGWRLRCAGAIRRCGRAAHSLIWSWQWSASALELTGAGSDRSNGQRLRNVPGHRTSVFASGRIAPASGSGGRGKVNGPEYPASVLPHSSVGLMECARPHLPNPAPDAGGSPPSRCSRWWRRWAWRSRRWLKAGRAHRCHRTSRRLVGMDTIRTTKPRARRVRRGPFREPHRVLPFRRWTTSRFQCSSAARSIASSRAAFTLTPIRARLPQ